MLFLLSEIQEYMSFFLCFCSSTFYVFLLCILRHIVHFMSNIEGYFQYLFLQQQYSFISHKHCVNLNGAYYYVQWLLSDFVLMNAMCLESESLHYFLFWFCASKFYGFAMYYDTHCSFLFLYTYFCNKTSFIPHKHCVNLNVK